MDMTGNEKGKPVRIRRAVPDDLEQVYDVWSRAGLGIRPTGRESEHALCRQIELMPDMFLVATDRDRIVGVILGSHDHRKGWINRLAVLPEYQRHGVASALMTACETAIRAHGIDIITALVEEDNPTSSALFERLGYRTDVQVRYFRKLFKPDA